MEDLTNPRVEGEDSCGSCRVRSENSHPGNWNHEKLTSRASGGRAYTGGVIPRRAFVAALLSASVHLGSCGGNSGLSAPAFVNVRVTYVSLLPAGCPDIGNVCYPGCAHHNAPAGLQAVVPLWGAETLRLTDAGSGRYEGVLTAVPTNAPLRLYGRDIGMCCVDACN